MGSKVQRLSEDSIGLFPTASWDIETTNLSADFAFILCASVKPWGKPPVVFRIDQYENYEKDRSDDSALVTDLANELKKYTIAIGYNTQRFDVPFLYSRMLYHGMDIRPLASIKHLDLIWAVRYRMRLRSASLAVASEHMMTGDKKTPLIGRIWAKAAAGNKEALDDIVKHNVQDVKVLEQMTKKLAHLLDIKFTLIK